MFRKKYKKYSPEKLMELYAKGDTRAFETLYGLYSEKMYYFFLRSLNYNHDIAGDFLQELFLKVIEQKSNFDPAGSFQSWIYRIASNMLKNEYRRKSVRATVLPVDEKVQLPADPDEKIFAVRLMEELDRMGEGHREVFILRFRQELKIKEVAEVMGISEGTVKSRLFHIIKKLSVNLSEFNPGVEK